MIGTIVEKLLDRMILLRREHKLAEREQFSRCVEPVYVDFEAVHNNYLNSVARYREILLHYSGPLDGRHPIFIKLVEDSIASQHLRNKLVAFRNGATPSSLEGFFQAIFRYLHFSGSIVSGDRPTLRRLAPSGVESGISGDPSALLFALDGADLPERFEAWFGLQLLAEASGEIQLSNISFALTNRPRALVARTLVQPRGREGAFDIEPILCDLDAIEMVLQENHLHVTTLRSIHSLGRRRRSLEEALSNGAQPHCCSGRRVASPLSR